MSEPTFEPSSPVGVLEPDETVGVERPWVVLVWNDPINLMPAVSSGTRESAERDVFRLHEHGLWATMQQDD